MPSFIEIQYNPYIPRMKILIDGKQPPEFSRLIQYSDEDIWCWYHQIPDTIYAEVRNEFAVLFTGTAQDALLFGNICKKHEHCCGFKAKELVVSDSLQNRMQRLNQYLKRTRCTVYSRTIIDTFFLLTPGRQKYMEDVLSIDVNNLYCAIRINMLGMQRKMEETDTAFLFVIADDSECADRYFENLKTKKPVFVIRVGKENGLDEVTSRAWIYNTTPENLLGTIFSCMFQGPLLLAFRNCIKSLETSKENQEIRKLSCVEPLILVNVDSRIEAGTSAKIDVSLDPPVGQPPRLLFKIANQTVASCDGLYVFGKKEGNAVLEVYRCGDASPFSVQNIEVYKRNRIRKLFLSEDSLVLGMDDRKKLECDYLPSDADNVQMISWKSSDERIVRADRNGVLTAVGLGNCHIICTAENVSAQCICTVKPYLKEMTPDVELREGVLYMEPFQKITLGIRQIPEDCVDSKYEITSSDYDVVNVVKDTLYAKSGGQAEITVHNVSGKIRTSFWVMIRNDSVTEKNIPEKRKFSFFRWLLGKE